jgi:ParB-like chromosome segregation protein Spo0J
MTSAGACGDSRVKNQIIGLSGIAVSPDRIRKLRPEKVDELAESMKSQGQLQPIIIRPHGGIGYMLVAGWHRLAAAKKLKWEGIRAEIRDGLEADAAELAEIDENLVRADLTPAERAMHTHRRKALYEHLHPETKHGGTPGAGRGKRAHKDANLASFSEATAKATRQSKRTVAREAARGEHVQVLPDVVGTSLDKGDELDALARLPLDEQQRLAEQAKAGDDVSAKTRLKQVQRQERDRELAENTAAAAVALGQLPPASVIVCDPALKHKTWSEKGMDRAADNHYQCDTLEKMIALKPPMANDVILFLWTWSTQLRNSIKLLEAWSFDPSSTVGTSSRSISH